MQYHYLGLYLKHKDYVAVCFMNRNMGCYRITTAETVSLQSNHGIVILGSIAVKKHSL